MAEPIFELEIVREIRIEELAWIEGEDAADDSGLGCNRDYRDLRATTWPEVDEVIAVERQRFEQSQTRGFMDSHEIQELDVGVAGATLALAAAGCVPFTSCNGGGLGGRHEYEYPLVAFYLPPSAVAPVVAAAAEADTGLFQDPRYGTVQVYGRQLIDLHKFACAVNTRREQLRATGNLARQSSERDGWTL